MLLTIKFSFTVILKHFVYRSTTTLTLAIALFLSTSRLCVDYCR